MNRFDQYSLTKENDTSSIRYKGISLDGFEAAVDFSRDRESVSFLFDLGGEGRLRPIEERRRELTRLICVVVDRLLAQNDQIRLLFQRRRRHQFGNLKGLNQVEASSRNFDVDASERADKKLGVSSC